MFPGTDALSWLWAIAGLSFSAGFILWVASSWRKDSSSMHNQSELEMEMEDESGAEPARVPRWQAIGVDLMVVGLIVLVIILIWVLFLPG